MQKSYSSKKMRLILAAILIAGLGIGTRYLLTGKAEDNASSANLKSGENAIAVQVKKMSPETITQGISVSAVTEFFEEVEIYPEINGKVADFYHSEGDYIKKGQILAKLEPDNSLLVNFENAKINLKIAKESAENTKKLQKQLKRDAKGTSAYKAVKKKAELSIDAAEGQVDAAQGQVDYIQSQLDKYSIKAPSDGFISKINLDNGDTASVKAPIATIANSNKVKIEAGVTEFDISKITSGQEVEVNLASCPDDKFIGEVYYVGSSADPASKKFPVKIRLENKDRKIKAGMVANVKICKSKLNPSALKASTTIL